ncbi:MAG: stage II sporulation protein M [Tissierellaceae bacterium]|nr:stage II sporulation protein M [Tissierellaceae bacterium]
MLLNRILRILKKHFQNYFLYYFVLALVLIVGIIIGSLIINLFDLRTKIIILKYSNPYYKIALLNDLQHSVMRSSILGNVFLVILIIFMSFINIGIFIVPIVILIKGVSLGFTVGFLVSNFGLKGFLLSIGGIYPQNIFILSGLIGLAAIAMSMTNFSNKKFRGPRLRYPNRNIDESILSVGVYSLIIILGAIIEGLISPRFLSLTIDFFV